MFSHVAFRLSFSNLNVMVFFAQVHINPMGFSFFKSLLLFHQNKYLLGRSQVIQCQNIDIICTYHQVYGACNDTPQKLPDRVPKCKDNFLDDCQCAQDEVHRKDDYIGSETNAQCN